MLLHVLFIAILGLSIEALECGIHIRRNEELKTTVNKCVSSNKTLEDLWDMTSMSGESSEEEPSVDGKVNFRTRRADVQTEETKNDGVATNEEAFNQSCTIQCIFDSLQLTDPSGYPSRPKILEGLLKNATQRELRDFLQDTTDECFQVMDKEVTMNPCAYSTRLLSCMGEKGKANCADWPVGDLPLQ